MDACRIKREVSAFVTGAFCGVGVRADPANQADIEARFLSGAQRVMSAAR